MKKKSKNLKKNSTNLSDFMSITSDFPKVQRDRGRKKRGETNHTTHNYTFELMFSVNKFLGQHYRKKNKENKRKQILRNKFSNTYNLELIVNLTSFHLTIKFSSILSKGVKFVTKPTPTRWQTIFKDALYIKYYFEDNNDTGHSPF